MESINDKNYILIKASISLVVCESFANGILRYFMVYIMHLLRKMPSKFSCCT